MKKCEYVREYYGVPAQIGRVIIHRGNKGIIAEDRGHYIGVNFDDDKPGRIYNIHPTDEVEYKEIGKIRKQTRSQEKYQRYLEYGDGFNTFMDFIYWHDSKKW